MDKYLKQKINPADIIAERIKKEMEYNEQLKKLKSSSAEVVPDFQAPVTKDLPVDRIDNKAVIPQTSGADFQARQIADNARREAKLSALGKMGDTIDYSKFKNFGRTAGKKMIGAVPFLGAGYAALQGDSAMAAEELAGDVPVIGQAYEAIKPTMSGPAQGSFDQRLEQGLLTPEEKMQMQQEQMRIKALRGLSNG